MPELDIDIDDATRTSTEIISVLLYPEDEQKRRQFKCALILKGYVNVKKEAQTLPGHSCLADYLDIIKQQTTLINFINGEIDFLENIFSAFPDCLDFEKQYDKALRIVGLVFKYKMTLIDKDGGKLSQNKAVYVVSKQSGLSESVIKSYISKYRSIAHMVCAIEILKVSKLCNDKDESIAIDQINFLDEEHINIFLSLSESIRLSLECDIEKKTKKPSLDHSCTWKVPKSYPIKELAFKTPKISVNVFPSLAGWLNDFNKKYIK